MNQLEFTKQYFAKHGHFLSPNEENNLVVAWQEHVKNGKEDIVDNVGNSKNPAILDKEKPSKGKVKTVDDTDDFDNTGESDKQKALSGEDVNNDGKGHTKGGGKFFTTGS